MMAVRPVSPKGMRAHCRIVVLTTTLLLGLLLHSCTPQDAAEPSQSERAKVSVLLLPYLGYAPFFIAQEEGYFEEQGLEVEYVKLSSSQPAVPLLVQGDLDVYVGSVSPGLFNVISRGAKVRIVSDKGQVGPRGDSYISLMARREVVEAGRLENPEGWKGLRIARSNANVYDYVLEKTFLAAGVSPQDVERRTIVNVLAQEALSNGSVDMALAAEPWVTRMIQSGDAVLWLPLGDVTPGLQFTVMVYGPGLVEEKPDVGKRFMVAFLKGVRQYNLGKTERNLDILEGATGLDRDLLKQMTWPLMREDGRVNMESLLDFQEWAVTKGLIDRTITEKEFWDPRFIEHAGSVLGEAPEPAVESAQ